MQLGLLGHQISYSLSPKIHLYSATKLGIEASYELFDLNKSEVPAFLKSFWDCGGMGLNVTTPFKELVAHEIASPLASINTLYRGENSWIGASTDGVGFSSAVEKMGVPLKEFREIICLGSGGVVLAILNFLNENTFSPQVHIFRRKASLDDKLRRQYAGSIKFYDFDPLLFRPLIEQSTPRTLVVQGTSAPLKGDLLEDFSQVLGPLKGSMVDLVYGKPSALHGFAVSHQIPTQDGLPMLIEQARAAQNLWWGRAAPYAEIKELF